MALGLGRCLGSPRLGRAGSGRAPGLGPQTGGQPGATGARTALTRQEPHLRAGGACCPRRRRAGRRSWRACWPTPGRGRLRYNGSLCSATQGSRAGLSHPLQQYAGRSAPRTCKHRERLSAQPQGPRSRKPVSRPPLAQEGAPSTPPTRLGLSLPLRHARLCDTASRGPLCALGACTKVALSVYSKACGHHHCPGTPPGRCPSGATLALGRSCCGVSKLHCPPSLPLFPLHGGPCMETGRGQAHRPRSRRQAVAGERLKSPRGQRLAED